MIQVNTTQPGVTTGQCSLQEAIYAAEFGTSIAISQVFNGQDVTYQTGCTGATGKGDTIVLHDLTYSFSASWDADAYNYMGPTATPIIFKNIAIQGNGATLQWTNNGEPENFRLFAIGNPVAITINGNTYSGTGILTLQNVYIKGFRVKGGDGGNGGGGGLGAGGAIYVSRGGSLTVENSTFDTNAAFGGNGGGNGVGGGGGGLSGNGGGGQPDSGGGGGGSRGNGGDGGESPQTLESAGGGGGGGTVFSGGPGTAGAGGVGGSGGYLCGGNGGDAGNNGHEARDICVGGGGGAGGGLQGLDCSFGQVCFGDGAQGSYGGGGGGGVANGGSGGFGGGGGAGFFGEFSISGGDGGFGGGGGAAYPCAATVCSTNPGKGGIFGGRADTNYGGGGGALGGAIFNDGGNVTVQNSTFYNNSVGHGLAGGVAVNGADAGGAIFSLNGQLTVENATISGNHSTGSGGGITFYILDQGGPIPEDVFTLYNTIVSNNGPNECTVLGHTTNNVSIAYHGAGDLIMSNGSGSDPVIGTFNPCPTGPTFLTSDPQLQPLLLNSPGNTPTMAILLSSPAAGAADSGTSLSTDQRGVPRPPAGRDAFDIGAYEARPPDFFFSTVNNIVVDLGGSGSTTVIVNSFEYFSAPVTLTMEPNLGSGFTITASPDPIVPPYNGSASSIWTVKVAPSVPAGSYPFTITGIDDDDHSITHSFPTAVIVKPTTAGIANVIASFLTSGAIDKSGIANALTTKLSTAQSFISAGDNQTAVNILDALINQLNAQNGKHLTASAASVLSTDSEALQTSLNPNLRPDPVMGYVLNSSNVPIAGATVNVLDASNAVIAAATTDGTGFYFFPLTRNLTLGSAYTVKVALPKGYKSSTPASQKFTWQAAQLILISSVLN
jgi:hypothetical protein